MVNLKHWSPKKVLIGLSTARSQKIVDFDGGLHKFQVCPGIQWSVKVLMNSEVGGGGGGGVLLLCTPIHKYDVTYGVT